MTRIRVDRRHALNFTDIREIRPSGMTQPQPDQEMEPIVADAGELTRTVGAVRGLPTGDFDLPI